jgi:hypothetical protein
MDRKCTMLLFLRRIQALLPRLTAPALIGILLVASMSAVSAAAGFSNVQETVITVKEKEVLCDGVPLIDADLVVKDQADNIITGTTVGTQVLIEGIVLIDCVDSVKEPRTTIFEIRDKDDITTFLAWQTISGYSDEQIVVSQSWTPDKPGKYEVRFFPLVCLNCPMVLNKVVTYEITVV